MCFFELFNFEAGPAPPSPAWARESRFGLAEWLLVLLGAAIAAVAVTAAVLTGSWNFILGPS